MNAVDDPVSIGVDPLSACVSQLVLNYDATILSHATGFFWRDGGVTYLVTNWHVFSGRDSITGACLDRKNAGIPNNVRFDVFNNRNLNDRGPHVVRLFEETTSAWLEHPQWGRDVDVACLALSDDVAQTVFPINQHESGSFVPTVAADVFVIGFPLAIQVERFPIWKRASIASEPGIDVDGQAKLFVDTAGTTGMSGSPVIHRANSGRDAAGRDILVGPVCDRLLGVYSGRVVRAGSLEAQLGIVWKPRVISEIIAGQKFSEV